MFHLSLKTLLLTLIICLFIYKIFTFIIKREKLILSISHIPGPTPLPFLGNILQLRGGNREILNNAKRLHEKYSTGWYKVWIGQHPIVYIQKAELVQAILASNENLDKDLLLYKFLKPLFGSGLVTTDGEKWKPRRRLLTPAFHITNLEGYLKIIIEEANILVKVIEKYSNTGEIFEFVPHSKRCTLDIIIRTMIGKGMNIQKRQSFEYFETFERLSDIIMKRIYNPWIHNDFIFNHTKIGKEHNECIKTLKSFGRKAIEERRQYISENLMLMDQKNGGVEIQTSDEHELRQKKVREHQVLLDLILHISKDQANDLDDEGILDEVNTFIVAGHDTTALGCSWALFNLGQNKHFQDVIVKEVDEIAPEFETEGISLSQLAELKFLERCIKETLRLYPIGPMFSRRIARQVDTVNGTLVPGLTVTVNTYLLHRDPINFPNPEKFDPDRFLPEKVKNRHPFAYVPFSAGPRNCIGMKLAMMEMKIILVSILKKYEVTSIPNAEPIMEVVLSDLHGIKLNINKRK